ncbi:MAG: hypothetical protein ACXU71_09275 [Croceibacterium sp.]
MSAPDTLVTDPLDDYALVRGWTPERMTRFLDHLAQKGNVQASCKRVGLSREAAYRLRRRDPLFARGWAAAMVKAHDASIEVLADRAIDGVEEPIYHRGELVGTRRRYDTRLLLAHIARLDKLLEDKAAQADTGRFDELLARIAGEDLPAGLDSEDGVLPLDRDRLAERWGMAAEYALHDGESEDDDDLDEQAAEARADEWVAAYRDGRADGEMHWDNWFDNACGAVDYATGWLDEPPASGLPGGPQLPRRECETAALIFRPRTLSEVSTGAVARAPAGPPKHFVPPPPLRSPRQVMAG